MGSDAFPYTTFPPQTGGSDPLAPWDPDQAARWAKALVDYDPWHFSNSNNPTGAFEVGSTLGPDYRPEADGQPKPWPLTNPTPDRSDGTDWVNTAEVHRPGVAQDNLRWGADNASNQTDLDPAADWQGRSAADALAPIKTEIGRVLELGDGASADQLAECATPGPQGAISARIAGLSKFASQYDRLSPVDFSRGTTSFAYNLEKRAHDGQFIDRQSARDQYEWLQNRLSYLLRQRLTPEEHGNLLSAASLLYQGANNAGVINVGRMEDIPQSMLDVATGIMGDEGPNVGTAMRRAITGPQPVDYVAPIIARAPRPSGIGDHLDNEQVGIVWGKGIEDQGIPWERHTQRQLSAEPTPRNFPTWDNQVPAHQIAISDKTLNTLSQSYTEKPRNIFYSLAKYIDQAAAYNRSITHSGTTIVPKNIAIRQVNLAVPQSTTPEQWAHINRAIVYGRSRGVSVVVTTIRDRH
jgi:hypothetical protein